MIIATDLAFTEVEVAPTLAVQKAGSSASAPAAIGQAIKSGFHEVMAFVNRHGLKMNNQPRVIYTSYDPETVSFIVVLPVIAGPAMAGGDPSIFVDMVKGTKAYRFTHHGPYQNLGQTYNQITLLMVEKGLMKSEKDWVRFMPMWEEYVNDPETTAPDELITYIYLPA